MTDHLLICSGFEQSINIYDLKVRKFAQKQSTNKIKSLKGHNKRVVGLCLDDFGILYSASIDGMIRAWDLDKNTTLKILYCKEAIYSMTIQNNILYCGLYSEVFCHDIENGSKIQPFPGISSFFIGQNSILIGWNRPKYRFEFIDMKTRQILHTTSDESIFHTNSICITEKTLFYISGSEIAQKKINIKSTPSISIIELYSDLYSYYLDVLLYPGEKISKIIEELHSKQLLTPKNQSLDDQISLIYSYLRTSIKSIQTIESTPFQIQFIKDEKPIYTKEDFELDFESRTALFYNKIRETTSLQPTVILVRRENLVFDTCKHFSVLKKEDLKKQMYIFFAGEQGLDMGGVTREFYQLLSKEILDARNALFVSTSCNNTYHPNTTSNINESHLQYFTFIGKLIGKALYDLHMMDTHFTRSIFKMMIGKNLSFEDLEDVDPSLFLSLNKILKMNEISAMELNFTAENNDFGSNNIFSLVENGETLSVNEENKSKFVQLYAKWKIYDSVKIQIDRLLTGLYEIIPREFLKIFNEKELELLLCGNPKLDVDDWIKNTKIEGFDKENIKIVEWFWEMVKDMSDLERGKLLQYATGTTCVPNEGFEGYAPPFTICRLRRGKEFLPVTHTCLNRIDLPDYESKQMCRERFIQAMEYGLKEGFQID